MDVWSNRTQLEEDNDDCRTSGGQPESEEDGENLGMWRKSRKRKKALAARGADPSSGHMLINAMDYETCVKDDPTASVKFVEIAMTGSSRVLSERRANVWRRRVGRRIPIGATSSTF